MAIGPRARRRLPVLPGAAPSDTVAPRRHPWRLVARLVISAILAVVLVRRIDMSDVVPAAGTSRVFLFISLTVAGTVLQLVLQGWRWQKPLEVLGQTARLGTLVQLTFIGHFVGMFLPSTIGGDVMRVRRLGQELGDSEAAFVSVSLERLTGFITLPFLVGVGLLLSGDARHVDRETHHLPIVLAAVGLTVLVVLLTLAGHPSLAGRFKHHTDWLRFLGALHVGLDGLRQRPDQIASVLASALTYQASVLLTAAFGVRALGIHGVSALGLIAFAPCVSILQVLPLSFGGFGLRETAWVLFLRPLDVSGGQAVGLGLLLYAAGLIASLGGAPALVLGSRTRSATAATSP